MLLARLWKRRAHCRGIESSGTNKGQIYISQTRDKQLVQLGVRDDTEGLEETMVGVLEVGLLREH